jgi:hypothetical protein
MNGPDKPELPSYPTGTMRPTQFPLLVSEGAAVADQIDPKDRSTENALALDMPTGPASTGKTSTRHASGHPAGPDPLLVDTDATGRRHDAWSQQHRRRPRDGAARPGRPAAPQDGPVTFDLSVSFEVS